MSHASLGLADTTDSDPRNGPTILRRIWTPANIVIAVSAGLIVIIFAIFAALCVQGYNTTLDQAQQKAQSAADVVAEEAEWMLGGSKALLTHLAAFATVPADVTESDRASIDAALKALPVPTSFGLYDATGAAFGGVGAAGLPASIGDLQVFKALAAGQGFAISRQVNDPSTGAPLFVLAQKLTAPEGFGGAAVITISGAVMQELWAPQQLGPGSTVGLLLPDGWLVARYPAAPQSADSSQQPLFTTMAGQENGTYFSPRSPVDGIARVVGFRRLPALGVIAVASMSQDAAVAGLWTAIVTVLWLMCPIAVALFIGSLVTAGILRKSARTQANLAAALTHNETLFREIHHRVKNNLQSVASLLQMQPIPREIKADMGQRIAAMSAVHEHIYRSTSFDTVRVQQYLTTLIENIRAGSGPNVQVREDIEDLEVDKDAATPLGLIVNEVVANAFKHGFPDGRKGTIRVSLMRRGDGRAELSVADDGVGFDPEQPSKGIGRRLIRALTSQLGGESEVTSGPGLGSRFVLVFPLGK
ncbi:MAG: sensor histidine kinase [Devosia sp.]|jgi:two-component sensor histidine kinase